MIKYQWSYSLIIKPKLAMMKNYIDVADEAGRDFFASDVEGPVTMLNLLRYREFADLSQVPHLKPDARMSGKEAYKLYMRLASPFIKDAGSEVLFYGSSNSFLIGPSDERWDAVLLVRYASKEAFLKFALNKAYLKITVYRNAGLLDSRLLPIKEGEM